MNIFKCAYLIENHHRHLSVRSDKEIAFHQAILFFSNFHNKKIPNTKCQHFEKRDGCWVAYGCGTPRTNFSLLSARPLWKGKYLFWRSNKKKKLLSLGATYKNLHFRQSHRLVKFQFSADDFQNRTCLHHPRLYTSVRKCSYFVTSGLFCVSSVPRVSRCEMEQSFEIISHS